MADNPNLNGQQFYHASNWDFEPGQTLTPEGARRSHVFYTDSLGVAARHGTNVYRVTPETPGQDRTRSFVPWATESMTRSSLRVEGKLSPDEVKAGNADFARQKADWLTSNGGG